VVIDARMHEQAGIGRYLRSVVPRIVTQRPAWQFTILVGRNSSRLNGVDTNRNVVTLRCRSGIYSLREQAELLLRTPRDADVFWSPHYNIPVFSRIPVVVTVHDVAHLALPTVYPGLGRRTYSTRMFAALRSRATAVMFDSDFTAREFARYVGPPRRSATIPLGVDDFWFRESSGVPSQVTDRPYLLFVGSVKPHKNLGALVAAFGQTASRIPHDLVIVGALTGQRTIDHAAIALGERFANRVRFLDRVEDDALRALVRDAACLVLPSLYEGFGLPALEAMAAGCPCLVSNVASLPEICGDAALYCDPHDINDIAEKMMVLLENPTLRAGLVERGRRRATEFTWDRTAAAITEVLESSL
jgi:glycosyltransferase involved in cell wall biosynthesis